ncbi:hypothetical protein MMC09_001664 [Bachmanniomyces sp. S44760]|nr:hypothetical protein [Bachmanniomyces sp. S44760]
MSRRTLNPAADRAAQNQQTIKSLLKLEANKICADCKRNRHPRWASWNLGVFVCIRCSGIHRGMGTHISRVKSVDLDSWTDEQLQSVLRWGNARANKYWEAKLAPGHVPAESKIENFIRTKYDSKRWVMDGPMPDPSTLDAEGDDDVPLNLVQEKAKLERSASQRTASTSSQPPPAASRRPQPQNIDLMGGDDVPAPPVRPSTTDSPGTRPPPPRASTPSKQLLGLDFLGGSSDRPSSSSSSSNPVSSGPSRPDLKQSILSLYASAPRPQSQSQPQSQPQTQPQRQGSFGGTQSTPAQQSSSFGGLNDDFAGLSFNATSSAPAPQPHQQPKPSPFSNLGSFTSQKSTPAPTQYTSPPPLSGGGFFDTGPKPPPKQTESTAAPPQAQKSFGKNSISGFGDFTSALKPATPSAQPNTGSSTNGLLNFSMASPAVPSSAKPSMVSPNATSPNVNSAFNLSAPTPAPSSVPQSAPSNQSNFSGFSNAEGWGSSDPWATPEPPKTKPAKSPSVSSGVGNDFGGWGGSSSAATGVSGFGAPAPPKIAADEDFGGWNSAAPAAPAPAPVPAPAKATQQGKPAGGFGGSEDLFSNVWE